VLKIRRSQSDESRAEQEIVGFFVAPFTGTYNFYLAADDEVTCEF
jgi:hypothetical protein